MAIWGWQCLSLFTLAWPGGKAKISMGLSSVDSDSTANPTNVDGETPCHCHTSQHTCIAFEIDLSRSGARFRRALVGPMMHPGLCENICELHNELYVLQRDSPLFNRLETPLPPNISTFWWILFIWEMRGLDLIISEVLFSPSWLWFEDFHLCNINQRQLPHLRNYTGFFEKKKKIKYTPISTCVYVHWLKGKEMACALLIISHKPVA